MRFFLFFNWDQIFFCLSSSSNEIRFILNRIKLSGFKMGEEIEIEFKNSIPDYYKTKEICVNAFDCNISLFTEIPYQLKTKEMCEKAVEG